MYVFNVTFFKYVVQEYLILFYMIKRIKKAVSCLSLYCSTGQYGIMLIWDLESNYE